MSYNADRRLVQTICSPCQLGDVHVFPGHTTSLQQQHALLHALLFLRPWHGSSKSPPPVPPPPHLPQLPGCPKRAACPFWGASAWCTTHQRPT